jgi:mannosyltransferase
VSAERAGGRAAARAWPHPAFLLDAAARLATTYAGRIGLITAAGLAARLALLGYQPLWRDEAFTAVAVSKPLGPMLDAVRADSAPPLAYLVDHAIASLWSAPSGLRLLPALAGGATIPLGAALVRRIGGDRAGIAGALVCAAAPALVLNALDARMYSIATALVMGATLALWRALERPRTRRFALYATLMALALYTDYFAVLAIPAQILAVRVGLRASRRTTVAAAGSAAVAGLTLVPWLAVASSQATHAGQSFWVPPLSFASVGGAFAQLFAGPAADPWVPLKPVLQTFQGFAVAAGVLMCFALVWRWRTLSAQRRGAARYLVVCGVVAALLLLPISVWRPLVDGRYASVVWGPLFAVAGAGLAAVPWRRAITAGIAVTAAASLALALAPTHPDTKSAVASLLAKTGPHDLVDAYPSQYLLLLYYAPPQLLARTRVLQQEVAWFWGTADYPRGAISANVPHDVIAARGTIYYVRQPDEPDAVLLPAGYAARATQCWTGVCIVTYTPQR